MNIENTIQNTQKQEPVLLDAALQDIKTSLLGGLPWLNHAFGRAYKITKFDADSEKTVYPAVYNGNGEYLSVLPNDNFGNFSWFDIYDPMRVEQISPRIFKHDVEGAIVFWINSSTIYTDRSVVYSEELKKEILDVLTRPGVFTSSGRHIQVTQIYERFENIYRGYSIEKVYNDKRYSGQSIEALDKQYFMYPYVGLRFEFKLSTQNMCF